MHIDTVKYNTYRLHAFLQAAILVQIQFYFMHTHIHTCVGVVNGPSHLCPLSSLLLWFMKCLLVAPQSTQLVQPLFVLPFVQPIMILSPAWNRTPGSCMTAKKSMHWSTIPHSLYFHSISLVYILQIKERCIIYQNDSQLKGKRVQLANVLNKEIDPFVF